MKLYSVDLSPYASRLDPLESLVVAGPYGAGASLSLADCTAVAEVTAEQTAAMAERLKGGAR